MYNQHYIDIFKREQFTFLEKLIEEEVKNESKLIINRLHVICKKHKVCFSLLAKKLKLNKETFKCYVRNQYQPSYAIRIKLCKILDHSYDEIFIDGTDIWYRFKKVFKPHYPHKVYVQGNFNKTFVNTVSKKTLYKIIDDLEKEFDFKFEFSKRVKVDTLNPMRLWILLLKKIVT